MVLITWNVNHRARPKPVPALVAEAIASLRPDVAVLTEYVPGPSHMAFLEGLAFIGLEHALVSPQAPKENQVLVASRSPMEAGTIKAPHIAPSVPSNVLHVQLTLAGLEILGVRIPDYGKQLPIKRQCWDWIITTAKELRERPSVILGDFNTDPKYPLAKCGDRISMLANDGWEHAVPLDGASYWTLRGQGVRIDHAFVSRHFAVRCARYVSRNGPYALGGRNGKALSDHAALLVDIAPRAGG